MYMSVCVGLCNHHSVQTAVTESVHHSAILVLERLLLPVPVEARGLNAYNAQCFLVLLASYS